MVAITGANGLLGSYLLQKFEAEKITILGIKRESSNLTKLPIHLQKIEWRNADVRDSDSLLTAFEGVDCVIHAAAFVSFDPRDRKRLFEINVEGTRNVVNACLALKIPRLIHISSVAALGRQKNRNTISEKNTWVKSSLNSDYAESKYLAELEVYRGQEEGLSVSLVNPSVILAPDRQLRSSAQIFKYVMDERKFFIERQLNYVDVRDVSESVWQTYSKKISGEKFIANAGPVQLKYLLDEIASRLGKKAPFIKINPTLVTLAAWIEELRCRLNGSRAVISRQSIRSSQENFVYENSKSIFQLPLQYHSLAETLDWCCKELADAYSTNKQLTQD